MLNTQPSDAQAALSLLLPCGVCHHLLLGEALLSDRSTAVISSGVILVNTETKFDHPVDPLGVCLGILQTEARRQESCFVQQDDQILHRLVILVSLCLCLKVSMREWSGLISRCFLAAM